MLKKIKELCLSLGIFSLLAVPVLVPATVFGAVDSNTIKNSLCDGTQGNTDGTNNGSCADPAGTPDIQAILKKIIQILSLIVGFVAVVMVIVGGIKYVTSGGDSAKTASAKNTLIYAIVGLIIVALAQILVHYVLNAATTPAPPDPPPAA